MFAALTTFVTLRLVIAITVSVAVVGAVLGPKVVVRDPVGIVLTKVPVAVAEFKSTTLVTTHDENGGILFPVPMDSEVPLFAAVLVPPQVLLATPAPKLNTPGAGVVG